MRKIKVFAVIASIAFLAACGSGSSGGDTPEQAAENSYLAFASIVEYCLGDFGLEADVNGYLVVKQVAQTCDCPGGGTASIDAGLTTVTAENCRSAGGLNFNGSVTIDNAGLVNGTMTPFGECSSVTANNVGTTTCQGTVTGTCAGESATCTVVDGTGDECDVNC